VAGAIYYFGLQLGLAHELVTIVAIVVGFSLRAFAIMFNWGMPKFIYNKDLR
jgi:uncharacterized membrane protein YeiH